MALLFALLLRFFVGRVSQRRKPTGANAAQTWLVGGDQDSGMSGYALWANQTYEDKTSGNPVALRKQFFRFPA